MQVVKIPKKTKGEFREIAIPSVEEKIKNRSYLAALNKKAEKLCSKHVHGFLNKRSPVTNAKEHVGYQYSLSFDLKDFFDTVTPAILNGKLSKEEVEACMPDNRAYQGLPCSPAIANLAAIEMDRAILKRNKDLKIVYTRYADDLTFSFNDFKFVSILKEAIPQIIRRCGFKVNEKKTRLQDARFGNRVITGVAVGEKLSAPRHVRRKLRAAKYQNNLNSVVGLSEWIKLKEPKEKKIYSFTKDQLNDLCKIWGIRKIDLKDLPDKGPDEIDGNFLITGDVAYNLGLSNFTSCWSSCMTHPTGSRHTGATLWPYLRGTRIAAFLSEESLQYGAFERRKMKARALVHKFRDGQIAYDRIYGDSNDSKEKLEQWLKLKGYCHVSLTTGSVKVVGHVPKRHSTAPYLDSLKAFSGVSMEGREQGKNVWTFKNRS